VISNSLSRSREEVARTYAVIDSIDVGNAVTAMATLTVRNLDDDVRNELRSLAARHGRSMEAEARAALVDYVQAHRRPSLLEAAERFRRETGGIELELPARDGAAGVPIL
jgi:plasmid stability protein